MPLGIPQQQVIQSVPTQQQPSDERKAVEWLWENADSEGLKLFKFGEKLTESASPMVRAFGGLFILASFFKTADTLDKKLGN
jgi:hypothetical protein